MEIVPLNLQLSLTIPIKYPFSNLYLNLDICPTIQCVGNHTLKFLFLFWLSPPL
jgi:hypothetical protein